MHYKVFHERAAAMNFARWWERRGEGFESVVRRDNHAMSRMAVSVDRPEWATFVPAGRPESADFNFGLLAALVACVAFWVMVALTVHSLI